MCASSYKLGNRGAAQFEVATCAGPDDAPVTSSLDLNDCLGNSEGLMVGRMGGNAFNTCHACSASTTSADITCECEITGGDIKTSSFDLDTIVTNNNGILAGFDLPGFEIAGSGL
ncbi:Uu.00g092800.m01.CDS01 [Anthostomella pinea]|uniref:Uu.00g092800.m01.CDS01 n=1 Tax=Anthostomella pinea TaxID=933095 RepID=A0AAI8VNB6_9PEZI|nr:Uu.00g092800.m01.CDS01 [Anthostomella pinea]